MNKVILQEAAAQARGLAIDAVHACSSGHLGLPLGCAEIGATLFGGGQLSYHNQDPKWLNRDRFILSAGHGSMFIYSWLHLAGYELPLQEIKDFRKFHSLTPGHPEFNETPGVEATTGPLGQGVGNAAGYALSMKKAAAIYNTAEHTIFNSHVIALAGDGCLQEGVAREAIAFAGHNKLDNLVLIYDSNDVTLDALADQTQSENAELYFESLNWNVQTIDGHDLSAISSAIASAKASTGKPSIIIAKTEIGRGIPEVAGTAKGHGESGANFADTARAGLGLPTETFYVSDSVKAHFAEVAKENAANYAKWNETYSAWQAANPQLANQLANSLNLDIDTGKLLAELPEQSGGAATRASGGKVINDIAALVPELITGSADLFGSTKNYINDGGDFSIDNAEGKNIWFGIREHAMGAILNGIAYDGIFRASGATFLVFADYLRPAIRLAALANLPVTYIFTHDSVGVGEDGPTHQPVETVSGLRVIPGLHVYRPCDGEETVAAWVSALANNENPTALILSRQNLPDQESLSAQEKRQGTMKGGYILVKETAPLERIIMATGSEVHCAVEAAKTLGAGTRVVSMPCLEVFDAQSEEYKESVLPVSCTSRIAIEAGVSGLWWKYVGSEANGGKVIGIDRFGISAPGGFVLNELGMSAENIIAQA